MMKYLKYAGLLVLGVLIGRSRHHNVLLKYRHLMILALLVNGVFLLLSFIGVHPWSPTTSRCMSMTSSILVVTSLLGGEFLHYLMSKSRFAWYAALGALLIIIIPIREKFVVRKSELPTVVDDMMTMKPIESGEVYVDYWDTPTIKYHFDYFRNEDQKVWGYPENWSFINSETDFSDSLEDLTLFHESVVSDHRY